jgi:hypothetical protein
MASAVLFLGAIVHIAFGYPPLARAVASVHITKAPGMSPGELKAVWLVCAVLMLSLSVLPLLVLGAAQLLRRLSLVAGAAAFLCGALVAAFAGVTHPAVVIFALSAILFIVGTFLA